MQGARSRLRSEKNVSWDKEDITSTQVHNWLYVYVPYNYLPGYVGLGLKNCEKKKIIFDLPIGWGK